MKPSRVSLYIDGFNQLKLLGELTKNGIKAERIKRESASKMELTVSKSDSQKTFAILDKMCYNYTVKMSTDLKSTALRCLERAGLIIGLIAVIAVLVVSYGFIWHIDIQGNEKVDAALIERTLSKAGISRGTSLKKADVNTIKNTVNAMDGITETSVKISGTTVFIEVLEDTEYEPVREPRFDPLVSAYDAEITRMSVTSGTAEAERGDRVLKGATLIAPYRKDKEENRVDVPASGSVYGKASFSKAEVFSLSGTELVRTGKTYVSTDYKIWGIKIYDKKKHNFASYETERITFDGFKNMFLPAKITRTVYHETAEKEYSYELDERIEYFTSSIRNDIIIRAGASEAETSYVLTQLDENLYRINVYVTAEVLLAKG